jgi:hypothetical protein
MKGRTPLLKTNVVQGSFIDFALDLQTTTLTLQSMGLQVLNATRQKKHTKVYAAVGAKGSVAALQ